jgi:hypothetical protein
MDNRPAIAAPANHCAAVNPELGPDEFAREAGQEQAESRVARELYRLPAGREKVMIVATVPARE